VKILLQMQIKYLQTEIFNPKYTVGSYIKFIRVFLCSWMNKL
jgi:hypothetical protein